MKVLVISSYGVLGGAELALGEFLSHRPADVEVQTLLVEDGPLRARLSERGVPTWTAGGMVGRPGPSELVRFSRSLMRLLGRTEPDVVLAFGLKAASMGVPACRLAGVPLVWYKVDFSLDDVLTRPLGMAVNGVVSVSEAVADALGPLRARRLLAVVGPPVRLPRTFTSSPVAIRSRSARSRLSRPSRASDTSSRRRGCSPRSSPTCGSCSRACRPPNTPSSQTSCGASPTAWG